MYFVRSIIAADLVRDVNPEESVIITAANNCNGRFGAPFKPVFGLSGVGVKTFPRPESS
jgi:hypothetical protein